MRKSIAAGLAVALLTAVTLFGVQALGGSLIVLIGLVAILAFVLVAMADVPAGLHTPQPSWAQPASSVRAPKLDASACSCAFTWCLGVLFGLLSPNRSANALPALPENHPCLRLTL